MIIEPAATTAEQITCQFSSTATMAARLLRFLFTCAKRQPATPIRKLRLAPSSGSLTLSKRSARRIANGRHPGSRLKTQPGGTLQLRTEFWIIKFVGRMCGAIHDHFAGHSTWRHARLDAIAYHPGGLALMAGVARLLAGKMRRVRRVRLILLLPFLEILVLPVRLPDWFSTTSYPA